MRIAFAGTPDFARVALERLLDAGFELALVLTQPDRPSGRGMRLQPSPVKTLALERGLPLEQPAGLRLDGRHGTDARRASEALLQARPEAIVVAAYGLILPQWLLDLPRLGCFNIHASLLPRWRGAAPIQRAIEAGDDTTGVTIMRMDAGLDTGGMLLAESEPIGPDDTSAGLHDRLAALGGRLIVQALERAADGSLTARPQPAEGVSYARKLDKAEAAIDWSEPAAAIERRVRAFDPFPGASFDLAGSTIKLWRAVVVAGETSGGELPGRVLRAEGDRLTVACGVDALDLQVLQRPGGRRVDAREFIAQAGAVLRAGTSLARRR